MERDDLIVNDSYSVEANHDEEYGKAIRKKIWFVTGLLTAVTAVEVAIGAMVGQGHPSYWTVVKWFLLILTIVKAAYIVLVFMHLGDEKKNLRWVILGPYIIFIAYLIFIGIRESVYINLFG